MVQVLNYPYEETKPILAGRANEPTADTNCCRRNSCAEEAYKIITYSMKAEPLDIKSPIVALNLFTTAVNVRNVPLAKQCVEILHRHVNGKNALLILSHLSKCKIPTTNSNNFQPSAPPIVENDNQRNENWVQYLIDELSCSCLLTIDKNADYVLKQKEILDLSYNDLLSISNRDTLEVSRETLVYSAIMRWCFEECNRRTLQAQPITIKALLRELVYAPRYGLMSKKDFLCKTIDGVKGPTRSGILEEHEIERIVKYIKRPKNKPVKDELPFKGSYPRVGRMDMRNFKSKETGSPNSKDSNCSSRSTCDKWVINFLTCWTALFD